MSRSLVEFGFYPKCAGKPLKRCKQRFCEIIVILQRSFQLPCREGTIEKQTEARSLGGLDSISGNKE